ncbi:MAG: hypothetical protein QNK90_11165, partial [Opitutaceae bacterium]
LPKEMLQPEMLQQCRRDAAAGDSAAGDVAVRDAAVRDAATGDACSSVEQPPPEVAAVATAVEEGGELEEDGQAKEAEQLGDVGPVGEGPCSSRRRGRTRGMSTRRCRQLGQQALSRNRRCRAVVARGGGREGRVETLRGRCL